MTKVALVASSLIMRRWYTLFLGELQGEFDLATEAWDLKSLKKSLDGSTDLFVLSSGIAGMSLLEVLSFITERSELPVLVITEGPEGEGRAELLKAGATSVLDTPDGLLIPDILKRWKAELLLNMRASLRARRLTRTRTTLPLVPQRAPVPSGVPPTSDIICIGGSTGAPQAMASILRALPRIAVPIVVVIHCSGEDGVRLVEWLRQVSFLPVISATHGLPLSQAAGKVVLASAPDKHIRLSSTAIYLTDEPERHFCRPSVDILFESAAAVFGARAVGVLLTGMGVDGAEGLLKMKAAGAATLVQGRESASVFGMPGAAVALGAADFEMSEAEIASFLLRRFNDRFART